MRLVALEIEGLSKRYGETTALADFSISLSEGELVCLVGPSGCGKTTALRAVAGLLTPDSGEISIAGQPVFSARRGISMKPESRGIGLVYQDYALWPHLTVKEHLAFPMESRSVPRSERAAKIESLLELVHLPGFGHRRPGELSGGQQQRVALARALSGNPRLVLMDEPMSNLDARLRTEMRAEISRLVKQIGVATLYVTHDQAEAMSISDRIAVLREGRLVQLGKPAEVFEAPADTGVASFLGIGSEIGAEPGPDGTVTVAGGHSLRVEHFDTAAVERLLLPLAALHSEEGCPNPGSEHEVTIPVIVESWQYEGGDWVVFATVEGSSETVRFRAGTLPVAGSRLSLHATAARLLAFSHSGELCPRRAERPLIAVEPIS